MGFITVKRMSRTIQIFVLLMVMPLLSFCQKEIDYNKTVFNICQKNNWRFIITLKKGNLKTFHQEVELLKATKKKRRYTGQMPQHVQNFNTNT